MMLYLDIYYHYTYEQQQSTHYRIPDGKVPKQLVQENPFGFLMAISDAVKSCPHTRGESERMSQCSTLDTSHSHNQCL